eukprot:7845051-Lingulodinium_polyedra.AAC.1
MSLGRARPRRARACPSSASSSPKREFRPVRGMLVGVRRRANRFGNAFPGRSGKRNWPPSNHRIGRQYQKAMPNRRMIASVAP